MKTVPVGWQPNEKSAASRAASRNRCWPVSRQLRLYEMSPQAFTDGQLNILESGNAIPDLVDEAAWGVDFWLRMQDTDGGVRGGAGPNAAVTAAPDRDEHPIYLYGKDPVSSLSLAAVAAQLARILESLGRPQEAASYLERAEKAWQYGRPRSSASRYSRIAAKSRQK